MTISRRALLKSGVAATVFAPAIIRSAAAAGEPIVIASMYDLVRRPRDGGQADVRRAQFRGR